MSDEPFGFAWRFYDVMALAAAANEQLPTGRIGESVNEHGTPVSIHRCAKCGERFTVCPAVTDEQWGPDCLAEGCPSYDIDRDPTYLFTGGPEES